MSRVESGGSFFSVLPSSRSSIESVQWRIDSLRAVVPQDSLTLRALREREAQLEQVTWYTSRLVMVDAML